MCRKRLSLELQVHAYLNQGDHRGDAQDAQQDPHNGPQGRQTTQREVHDLQGVGKNHTEKRQSQKDGEVLQELSQPLVKCIGNGK